MKNRFGIVTIAFASTLLAAGLCFAADGPPGWAYGFLPAGVTGPPPAPAPEQTKRHFPGSTAEYTPAEVSNRFGPADWYPSEHPTMPEVVAHGKKPDVWACSLCHYPTGKGRPENAPIAGFPTAYFIQQMNDFRNGNRHSAEPRKSNTNVMITIAKGMTDEEIKAAAEYYGSMKWTPWVKVVETKMVPKTRIINGLFLKLEGDEKEPIGTRIIEVPENGEETELRNPHSGFIAYAPMGTLKKGEMLATKGAGKTTQCSLCHGADLKGMGPVPGLAGRPSTYLVRQMYDMQQGTRKGLWSELMKPVVANLTEEDMAALGAYAASLKP